MRKLQRVIYLGAIAALFGAFSVSNAQDRYMGGTGITVFHDRDFRGRSATYSQDMPSLSNTGFDNRISSLRIGPGENWEVCENINYSGKCVVVSGEESDLRRNNWNNKISSFRRAGGGSPGPAPVNPYIVLYRDYNYRGMPTNYGGPVGSLDGRAMSVTLGRGTWELCQGTNFTGRCVTITQSIPDLRTIGMNGRVASARPIGYIQVQPEVPNYSDWYVVLFSQANFRGNPTNYNRAQSRIRKSTRSVTIGRGVWELCTGTNFTGQCETLDMSRALLNPGGSSRTIRSLRPAMRQPR